MNGVYKDITIGATAHSQEFSARNCRRRSADVGGLHLATGNRGQGQGWIGYSGELQTRFAELLGDMYTQTLNAVNEHSSDFSPTDLPPETRSRLIKSLGSWHFEPHRLPDEEVLACTLILFEALFRIEGMKEAIGISMKQLSSFVHHLRQIYRWENSYHNFEHALDVLQASQSYLQSAGMIPPLSILLEPGRMWKSDKIFDSGRLMTSLGLHDLFVIYIAAIGHDVGHPGFSNVFMKNAQTPLSVVFEGKSALEHMHCQLLLRVMRQHGLGTLLDNPVEGFHVRKLLWDTVLATDMSVHADFMARFKLAISKTPGPVCSRQIVICQAILKCADISNPSRPYPVSQHWAHALMEEWTSQALLEKYLDLPPSVQPSDDPIIEAKSQVFFITNFAKPLLDLAVEAVPEMHIYADQCAHNLKLWFARCNELEIENAGIRNAPPPTPSTSPRQPDDYLSAFPLSLPPSHRSFHHEAPTLMWPTVFPRSSDSSSSSESNPCSPCDSVGSFILSPTDSSVSYPRPASSSGSSSSNGHTTSSHANCLAAIPDDGHTAIRAAGKLATRRQKSLNRNSWSASSPLSYSKPSTPNHPPAVALFVTRNTPPSTLTHSTAKDTTDTITISKPIKQTMNCAKS